MQDGLSSRRNSHNGRHGDDATSYGRNDETGQTPEEEGPVCFICIRPLSDEGRFR